MASVICCLAAAVMSWPYGWLFGARTITTSVADVNGTDCDIADEFIPTGFPLIMNSILFVSFIVCMTTLVAMYVMIYRQMMSQQQFNLAVSMNLKLSNTDLTSASLGTSVGPDTSVNFSQSMAVFDHGPQEGSDATAAEMETCQTTNTRGGHFVDCNTDGQTQTNQEDVIQVTSGKHGNRGCVNKDSKGQTSKDRKVVLQESDETSQSYDGTSRDSETPNLNDHKNIIFLKPGNRDCVTRDLKGQVPRNHKMVLQEADEHPLSNDRLSKDSQRRDLNNRNVIFLQKLGNRDSKSQVPNDCKVVIQDTDEQILSNGCSSKDSEYRDHGVNFFLKPFSQRRRQARASSSVKRIKRTRSWKTARRNAILRQTTFIMFLITLVYQLSFLPYLALMTVRGLRKDIFDDLEGVHLNVYAILSRSYYIQSAANPFIYGFFSSQFRSACKKLFIRNLRRYRPRQNK